MSMPTEPSCQSPTADAAGAGGDLPVLDPQAVSRLRELDPDNSRGFVVQVMTTYESALVRHLAALKPLEAATGLKQAGEIAHTLKSSSASVGALVLSSACARLERAAKAGDGSEFVPAMTTLLCEGARVLKAVRTMLHG